MLKINISKFISFSFFFVYKLSVAVSTSFVQLLFVLFEAIKNEKLQLIILVDKQASGAAI